MFNFRPAHGIISDDRRAIIKKNRKAIKELINLRKAPILDRLHEERVITLEDKEIIEVLVIILYYMYVNDQMQ